jgi:Uma2 family endonuclease
MSTDWLSSPPTTPVVGEPAWDIARLYPVQGDWSEEDYLALALSENVLIEFTDGCIEVLSMPTIEHQLILRYLLDMLRAFVEPRNLGIVLFSPLPVRTLVKRKYREPDLIFNFTENHARQGRRYYTSADLVMEVVSDDRQSHERDYNKKREDYAEAGIKEYWIVDPQEQRITVLALEASQYAEHGSFGAGSTAHSRLLEGFKVNVDDVFAAGKR